MKIFYKEHEEKNFSQELKGITKWFKHELLTRYKEYIVSNKQIVLHRWSYYFKKYFDLQDGTDSDSGEEQTTRVQTAELYFEPPSYVGMEIAIR